jgi:hypothetical protein
MRLARSLAVLGVVAGIAHAQAPDVTREFQAGVDAFRLGKLDEAKAHLEKAKALDPTLAGPNRFLAAVAQAQGRWTDCIAAARLALALNPKSAELADTRKLHDDCRTSAGRPAYAGELGDSAAIAVTSNVPGASVKIGGLTYGGTPLAPRPITAGKLSIDVDKAGWKPVHADVDALPGIVTDVTLELEPDPDATTTSDLANRTAAPTVGFLIVPAGDELWVDGSVRSSAAGDRYEVGPGEHVIEVRRPGRDPWRRRVHVTAGARTQLAPVYVDTATRETQQRYGTILVASGGAIATFGFAAFLVSTSASAEAREIARVETARMPGTIDESIEPLRTRADFEAARSRAQRWCVISTAAYGAALGALGAGAYFLFRGAAERSDVPPPFAVAPTAGRGVIVSTELSW